MRAISIFAGAGGFDLGARSLGIDIVRSVERDADCCATLAAAGFHPVQADVGDFDKWAHDLPPIDLLFGGPPCQPFSGAGRGLGQRDPRDGFPVLMAAIDCLRPRWCVVENVTRFLSKTFADYREQLLAALRERFASVVVWRLNAADFGVPQTRERVFIVCGPVPVECPAPSVMPWRSWGETLGRGGFLYAAGEYGFSPPREAWRPSATLTTAGCAHVIEDGKRHSLTLADTAALQGFPGGFTVFGMSRKSRFRQIGNAVPPPLGAAVLGAVLRADRVPRE